jgi:hypothetical protein
MSKQETQAGTKTENVNPNVEMIQVHTSLCKSYHHFLAEYLDFFGCRMSVDLFCQETLNRALDRLFAEIGKFGDKPELLMNLGNGSDKNPRMLEEDAELHEPYRETVDLGTVEFAEHIAKIAKNQGMERDDFIRSAARKEIERLETAGMAK